jgi:hypothetical protein
MNGKTPAVWRHGAMALWRYGGNHCIPMIAMKDGVARNG